MAMVWHSNTIQPSCLIRKSNRDYWQDLALRGSYLFLQQLDLILTILAMSLGLSELNPMMKSLLASPIQLALVKVAIPLLVVWFVPGKFLIPAIVLLCMVIGWDIKELLLVVF